MSRTPGGSRREATVERPCRRQALFDRVHCVCQRGGLRAIAKLTRSFNQRRPIAFPSDPRQSGLRSFGANRFNEAILAWSPLAREALAEARSRSLRATRCSTVDRGGGKQARTSVRAAHTRLTPGEISGARDSLDEREIADWDAKSRAKRPARRRARRALGCTARYSL
jgi:hypothetical protein